jgi:hypothetical protein
MNDAVRRAQSKQFAVPNGPQAQSLLRTPSTKKIRAHPVPPRTILTFRGGPSHAGLY